MGQTVTILAFDSGLTGSQTALSDDNDASRDSLLQATSAVPWGSYRSPTTRPAHTAASLKTQPQETRARSISPS